MRHLIVTSILLALMVGCASPTKSELDEEVRRLCAIDGGIRVYQTVTLPPDDFAESGMINFYRPTQGENALGPNYIFSMTRDRFTKKPSSEFAAQMSKVHVLIIRRVDGKLLSEMTVYERGGGDIPGPWHPSSYRCPEIRGGEHALMEKTFLKRDEGQRQ